MPYYDEKEWSRREVIFTCPRPKCGSHKVEEVMVDGAVTSEVVEIGTENCGADIQYGEQTNEDGHVLRYQCGKCGYTIVDDTPEFEDFTQDGLDENSLVMAIDRINKNG